MRPDYTLVRSLQLTNAVNLGGWPSIDVDVIQLVKRTSELGADAVWTTRGSALLAVSLLSSLYAHVDRVKTCSRRCDLGTVIS